MRSGKHLAVAVSIAGSDSGAGAGIQADLKTLGALGVHGATVITCVTAQNPYRVSGIEPCSPKIVTKQLEAVFTGLHPSAVKTGMLNSARIIQAVAKFLAKSKVPLVVDPVIISTSGARLLEPAALKALTRELFPMATLLMPNIFEAEAILGTKISEVEDLRVAAREINARFGCSALVKGGHLRGLRVAADIFYDGKQELLLTAPFIQGLRTHGTGCTYSAAVTGYLARGCSLIRAVEGAKNYVTKAIAGSRKIAACDVLGW